MEALPIPMPKALVLVPLTLLSIINPPSAAPAFIATAGGDPAPAL